MNDDKGADTEARVTEFSKMKPFIADKTALSFTLKNGDTLTGTVLWFDKYNISAHTEEHGEIIVPKHALLWYGPQQD